MKAGEIPTSANSADYLSATYGLEVTKHQELAFESYQAATKRWPDDNTAWMALGNSAYALGKMTNASEAFSQVIQQDPQHSAAWNNLAYSLAANACMDEARNAAACASRLAPTNSNIQQTVYEISAMTGTQSHLCPDLSCPVGLSEN